MNDEERRMWVLNDEGLYRLWMRSPRGRSSHDGYVGLMPWIRENRDMIDSAIKRGGGRL